MMRRLVPLLLLLLLVAGCRPAPEAVAATPIPALPVEVRLPRNAVQMLDHPTAIAADQARLSPYTDVMGVEINGEARAYPIGMLSRHEIANDTLGGRPILVAFCPLCNSGIVVLRPEDAPGRALTFEFSGRVLDNALVMVDRESGTFWSQSRLLAIEGPRAGETLELIPAYQGSWEGWLAQYPETTLVPGRERPPDAPLTDLPGLTEAMDDPEPPLNDYVVGIADDETAAAFAIRGIEAVGVVNDQAAGMGPFVLVALGPPGDVRGWSRVVDGQTLTFYWADDTLRDEESGSAWDPETGVALSGPLAGSALEALSYQITHWLGWVDLYPDSRLWHN